ncbi:6-pyruvoyl trahydropterin synthase family protein [Natronolimnohabitans innermongolicus]|uniref:6-pyruvoyl-tetrahydropterin synthase n=1 Tax=Natronolimnohabitans innermongolicus JCM 12255 TaxID=1227499 RepID=L9XLN6_9EURY|nr:6-carboxytetrahydropterin synthase [Natronolimnohabitans innermongolicus]ELY61558.1 6-pyruvoyl-tetrahydropterin synthase [Natronolimnohabitans innermongolicus JCM 12255]
MYAVSVSRTVIAQHFLTVPDPGPEGERHSHKFTIEATVRGPELNEYEYLVDIDALAAAMDDLAEFYRDRTLNELPAFEGANPSAERFARVFGDRLLERLETEGVTELRIEIEEDDVARVAHERTL